MTFPEESSTISQPSKNTYTDSTTEFVIFTPGKELFGKLTLIPQIKEASTVDDHNWDESSTSQQEILRSLTEKLSNLFISAKDQIFEDGMYSEFSNDLAEFITIYGHSAMEIISRLILSEQANLEVTSEAMRIMGRINNSITFLDRLWLLERGLYSTSVRVRDGATLGLAYLDDPIAITPLKYAIERERIPELRLDMEQVLSQLEDTQSNVSDKKNQKDQMV